MAFLAMHLLLLSLLVGVKVTSLRVLFLDFEGPVVGGGRLFYIRFHYICHQPQTSMTRYGKKTVGKYH